MFGSRKDLMSRREERELLKLGRRVFADHFPNPERAGCPPPDVLRAMAFRRQQAAPGSDPSDHLTVCSPCFRDYSRYRQQARQQTLVRAALVAAALLVILISATFLWRHLGSLRQPRPEIAQIPAVQTTLDLRHLSPARGDRPSKEAPAQVEIPARRLDLNIQLPVGSEEGQYEVAVFKPSGERIAVTSGAAALVRNVMTLRVPLDLSRAPAGRYVLGIRRAEASWSWYEAEVR